VLTSCSWITRRERGEEKSFIRYVRSSKVAYVADDIVQFQLSLMFADQINAPRFIVPRMNKFVQSVLDAFVASPRSIAAATLITSIMTGITIATFSSIASAVIGSSSRVLYRPIRVIIISAETGITLRSKSPPSQKKTITPIVDPNKRRIAEKQIPDRASIYGPPVATYGRIEP